MTPKMLTRPFDEEISNEGYDDAAAWARLVERALREMRYRRTLDLPHREVSLAEALSEPQGARIGYSRFDRDPESGRLIEVESNTHAQVIPLHGYSVKAPEKAV